MTDAEMTGPGEGSLAQSRIPADAPDGSAEARVERVTRHESGDQGRDELADGSRDRNATEER